MIHLQDLNLLWSSLQTKVVNGLPDENVAIALAPSTVILLITLQGVPMHVQICR